MKRCTGGTDVIRLGPVEISGTAVTQARGAGWGEGRPAELHDIGPLFCVSADQPRSEPSVVSGLS